MSEGRIEFAKGGRFAYYIMSSVLFIGMDSGTNVLGRVGMDSLSGIIVDGTITGSVYSYPFMACGSGYVMMFIGISDGL